ncbi:uncharacterized protein LOC116805918 [Drosophila grimshawi]|uniref:uncharacterized protein LOC116805918 n=1 Tax=Drosophila grimshawi TaxID=7222 RepID=UPI0013EF0DC9|nr:uncharacterized protein LOC116805918 [Drosophila grimshawi]
MQLQNNQRIINTMTSRTIIYDYENLTEQIKANMTGNAAAENDSKYILMVTIATITWLLLSCISGFIYCCNYWQQLGNSAGIETVEQSDQSELDQQQQSMLLGQVESAR